MAYQGGCHKGIEYGHIFNEKDRGRLALAVALFFKAYVEKNEHVRDIFKNHGGLPEDLCWPMPTFKAKLQELARKRDGSRRRE
eukprot:4167956-Pyramimonas_sp.AAC.1